MAELKPLPEAGTTWSLTQGSPGQCEYCGEHTVVKPEPFGSKPACRPCFFQIIDGDDDD